MKLYHGTTKEYAQKILENNFSIKRSGSWILGSGVYFTPDLECAERYGETILAVDVDEDIIETEILDLDATDHTLDGITEKAQINEYSNQYKTEGDRIASYVIEELMFYGLKADFKEGTHICLFSIDGIIEKEDIKEVI
jgi:hypothetical protein